MATYKTIPISCRISVENADKLRVLLEKQGITFRNLVENLIDGVNTFEVGVNTKKESVNTKMVSKSVNTNEEKCKHLVNTGVNTTLESVNTDKFLELSKDLRMPYDVMYSEIKRLTDSGELLKVGMEFEVHEQKIDLKEFLEVCHEVCADPQKMINETIKGMRKGK